MVTAVVLDLTSGFKAVDTSVAYLSIVQTIVLHSSTWSAPAWLEIMAPTKTEVKKGNRKKGGTQKRVESEEENQRDAELERQIQGEIERAQDQSMIQGDESRLEEEEEGEEGRETEDSSKQEEETNGWKSSI